MTGATVMASGGSQASAGATTLPPRPAGTAAACMIVAGRNIRKVLRTPQLMVIGTVQATMFLLILRYVFGGMVEPVGAVNAGRVPYLDFLVPGYIVSSALLTGAGAAVGTAEDIEQGFSDRLRSLPVTRMALLAGHSLGNTVLLVWSMTPATAVAFGIGYRIHGSVLAALAAFGLCIVFVFVFAWLFSCIGTLAADAQAAQGMSMLVFPVAAVSGAWVPVETMPGWLQPIAANQPITVMTNAVRSLVLGDPSLAGLSHGTGYWVLASLLWCVALMAVFGPVAVLRYGRRS